MRFPHQPVHSHVASPKRTFALVVGVERYEGMGADWDLSGPARDALRFARWLTGTAGVPQANVRLLLSPLDDPAALDWRGLEELRERYTEATGAHVEHALFDDLAACDGEFLWIYWAGHGFQSRGRAEMLLLYQDATPHLLRHLNLDAALHWWHSDSVAARGYTRQATLVDACRLPTPLDERVNVPTHDYGGGTPLPWRKQFRVYASAPGEAAGNNGAHAAGAFTEELLAALGTRTLDAAARELTAVCREINARFAELRAKGRAWQTPQFLKDQDWDGCSFLDLVPGSAEALPAPAPRLDQRAWDELGHAFAAHPLPPYTYDAYAWAFAQAGCAPPPTPGLPASSLIEIAHDLDARHGERAGLPLVLPFVRFLRHRATETGDAGNDAGVDAAAPSGRAAGGGERAWARRLEKWEKTTGKRLGAPALPPPHPAGHTATLVVRLEPAARPERYLVRVWLRRERSRLVWESAGALSLAEVRTALLDQLAEARADGGPAPARVVVDVPFGLLAEPFDEWPVPHPRRGPRALGTLYEVVVSCPEDRPAHGSAWDRTWAWLCAHGGRHPDAVRVLTAAEVTDALAAELEAGEGPACVVTHTEHATTALVLDAVLESGVPVAVWRRDGQPAAPLLARVAERPADIDVLALPGAVRTLRHTTGAPFGVLWDDPSCVTDNRSLA
ncbi:caspase family protein [Streptomyces sp. NPDC088923]|uniref:VMAP-C domain-containing protein n=1 Tax=Streptomyces sp. NPDC088923 TaxID=3365913 RepID=UPI0037F9B0F6